MSASMNKVLLLGNLTRDPELRNTPSGTAVASFSLAVNEKRGDKEDTLFIAVEAWDKLADACGRYLQKGSQALVEGKLREDRWEKDGQKHSRMKVRAFAVQFLSRANADGGERHADVQSASRNTPEPYQEDAADDNLPF